MAIIGFSVCALVVLAVFASLARSAHAALRGLTCRSLITLLGAVGVVLAAAGPATALTVTDTISKPMSFTARTCAPVSDTATLPADLRQAELLRPTVGARLSGLDYETPAQVSAAQLDGTTLTVTVTPDPGSCEPQDEFDDASWWDGDVFELTARVRARRDVKLWVRGTGRGDDPSIRPRGLPFGQRSAVVGTRWHRWGGPVAIGRGRVEFNPCVPDCASSRPQYFPVRVVLERPRDCGARWQYTRFRFRYTTSRRPAGMPTTYREFFGC